MRKILLLSAAFISTSVFAMDDDRKQDEKVAPTTISDCEGLFEINISNAKKVLQDAIDIISNLDFKEMNFQSTIENARNVGLTCTYSNSFMENMKHQEAQCFLIDLMFCRSFYCYLTIMDNSFTSPEGSFDDVKFIDWLNEGDRLYKLLFNNSTPAKRTTDSDFIDRLKFAHCLAKIKFASKIDSRDPKVKSYADKFLRNMKAFLNEDTLYESSSWKLQAIWRCYQASRSFVYPSKAAVEGYIRSLKIPDKHHFTEFFKLDILQDQLSEAKNGGRGKDVQARIVRLEAAIENQKRTLERSTPEFLRKFTEGAHLLSDFNNNPSKMWRRADETLEAIREMEGLFDSSGNFNKIFTEMKKMDTKLAINDFIAFFLNSGKIDELLARLPALWEVIFEKKTDSAEYREIEEYLQSLTFDFSKDTTKKSRSQRKRENQRRAKQAAQKAAMAQAEEARKKAAEESAAPAAEPVKAAKRTQQVSLPSHYASAGEISKEEEARKERHAKRLERQKREAKALAAAVAAGGGGGSGSAAATGAGAGAGSSDEKSSSADRKGPVLDRRGDFSLVASRNLTGKSREVDKQLQGPMPSIIKKDLVTYLKALGGRESLVGRTVGSHNTKITFDEIKGHSITLAKLGFNMTERNFALLSMGDNEKVPHYIVNQIQLLREKLKALKEAGGPAPAPASSDAADDDSSEYDDGDASDYSGIPILK
jgi:hypothetical protein